LNIDYQGVGTERLEQELRELFSGARIARMDRDTTSRKGAHQEIMKAMLDRRVDILIGTQMVAKGHDFPAVDLVGVIAADTVLNFPDFRSAERGFALLTQVAGRAGRGQHGRGRVLVQTFNPEHYALECALKHDYAGFYQQEIPFRQELGYPPCGHLINLTLSGNRTDQVKGAADLFAARLRQASAGVEILGPTPCPLARLRGKSRYQILLKAAERTALRRLLPQVEQAAQNLPRQVALQIDVDPLDML
jgi:primosomal protein N' (replication factor Y)